METLKRYYRIDRRAIYLLRFFLEAYDGIAGLSTLDSTAGVVVLCVAPGCEAEIDFLVEEIRKEILMEPLDSPESVEENDLCDRYEMLLRNA